MWSHRYQNSGNGIDPVGVLRWGMDKTRKGRQTKEKKTKAKPLGDDEVDRTVH